MPEKIYFKKSVYFGSSFWSFQAMTGWPKCFGPVVRRTSWQEYTAEQNYSPMAREQKREQRGA
jgi:hypothetical protein